MGRGNKHSVQAQRKVAPARERHKRLQRARTLHTPLAALNARPKPPNTKSKHHSYYEIVENEDKRKKLEFQITSQKTPPPGFEFIPIGNPDLTLACKELSREQDAMIFIVSNSSLANSLAQQVNRIGHHIRRGIVEQARKEVSHHGKSSDEHARSGAPEPIPDTQEEIDAQADSAIRDLFPRIPNTDRQTIIEHSFTLGAQKRGEPLVGLAPDIPLSRRVQLAVLAHIRHTHTRYDDLLKETTYSNARKAVEKLCLDILIKWRGDEENGRDQLDEILREVVVISDSESSSEDDEVEEANSLGVESGVSEAVPGYLPHVAAHSTRRPLPPLSISEGQYRPYSPEIASAQIRYDKPVIASNQPPRPYLQDAYTDHRARRGFKRYQAALSSRWNAAVNRAHNERYSPQNEPPIPSHLAENELYICYERQQDQWSSNHEFFTSNAQESNYGARGLPYPADLPLHSPTRAVPTAAYSGNPSGDVSKGISCLSTDSQQRLLGTTLLRPKETREYLIPSVEPLSPSSRERPAPAFSRAASPYRVLGFSKQLVGDARPQSRAFDLSRWNREYRRESMDGEPSSPWRPPLPVLQRQSMSNASQQLSVGCTATQPPSASPQITSTWNSSMQGAHVAAGCTTSIYPATNARNCVLSGVFGPRPPQGPEHGHSLTHKRYESIESGTETFPACEFREKSSIEHHGPPLRNARFGYEEPYRRPQLNAHYLETSINGAAISEPAARQSRNLRQLNPPQDATSIQLRSSSTKRSPPYLPRVSDSSKTKAEGCSVAHSYHPTTPSSTSHHEDAEPATMFVRLVGRQRQPCIIENRVQTSKDYDPQRSSGYQRHPFLDNLPQALPTYEERRSISTDHLLSRFTQPQRQAQDYVFQNHLGRHDYDSNQ